MKKLSRFFLKSENNWKYFVPLYVFLGFVGWWLFFLARFISVIHDTMYNTVIRVSV